MRAELAAAAALLGSWAAVKSGVVDGFDAHVGQIPRRGGPRVDIVMAHATDLGSVYGLAGTAAVVTAAGHRRLGRDLVVAGGLAWGLGQAAKRLLDRPRPYETGTPRLVAIPAGTSWPSGHSAVAAAMATVIVEAGSNSDHPELTGAAGLALAGFVGGSRLHVGVHHPTDVIAGWGVGVLCARAWQRVAHHLN